MPEAVATPTPAPAPRSTISVVTSENRAEYMAQRMAKPAPAPVPEVKTDAAADALKPALAPAPAGAETTENHRKIAEENRFLRASNARKEAEARAAEEKARADRLEAELAAARAAKTQEKASDGRPDINDPKYKDKAEQYWEDLSDWKVDQKLKQREEAQRAEAAKAAKEANERAWKAKESQARGRLEDFDDVMAGAQPGMTRELASALFESEIGADIAYFLAKSPQDHERMMKLTPTKMLREFDKIEAQLLEAMKKSEGKPKEAKSEAKEEAEKAVPRETEAATPPRKTREPPEPITPLNGANSASAMMGVDANGNVTVDFKSYKALRKAGKIR